MNLLEAFLIAVGGMAGYSFIAIFLNGFLNKLTKWERFEDKIASWFWIVSWIFLAKYPGRWLGKKVRVWHDKREADREEREKIRVAEERKQRIELEEAARELEEDETLFRNEQLNAGGIRQR